MNNPRNLHRKDASEAQKEKKKKKGIPHMPLYQMQGTVNHKYRRNHALPLLSFFLFFFFFFLFFSYVLFLLLFNPRNNFLHAMLKLTFLGFAAEYAEEEHRIDVQSRRNNY